MLDWLPIVLRIKPKVCTSLRRHPLPSLTLSHLIPHSPAFKEIVLTLSSKYIQNLVILSSSIITSCLDNDKCPKAALPSILAVINFYNSLSDSSLKEASSYHCSAQNSPTEELTRNKIPSPHNGLWGPIPSGPWQPLLSSSPNVFTCSFCSADIGLLAVSWLYQEYFCLQAFAPVVSLIWNVLPQQFWGLTPSPHTHLCSVSLTLL